MKRIFCDRCGEEIDYRGRSKQVDIVGSGVGTYDMCPQCMVEFRAFMKSKPQTSESKNENQPKKMARICGISFEE